MLGKTSKPVIEILTGALVSGHKAGLMDTAGSPRSHFESKAQSQSPRGLKNFDFGGVGLGIVAALEKSGGGRNEIPANKALFSRNLNRSSPIPIKINPRRNRGGSEETEPESLEEYTTIVTCHGPNKTYTKVYSDGVAGAGGKGSDITPLRIQSGAKSNRASVFHIAPARFGEAAGGAPASDFLSCCNLCQKKLDGKDIFMYRGEKAFCSTECRYRQMVVDERKENYCSSEASRTVDVAGSPQIFTVGILAT